MRFCSALLSTTVVLLATLAILFTAITLLCPAPRAGSAVNIMMPASKGEPDPAYSSRVAMKPACAGYTESFSESRKSLSTCSRSFARIRP